MTASTASITLPAQARHRADAPVWPFHTVLARVAQALSAVVPR